ncbi:MULTISPECIES: CbiX/SirB N-terminal domain-containing protein [Streptomyces]|uniref:CbiX/SirB N-terminal domain-containing protein n=2 Tax=Streptomyces TaxID=1883 RepID=A0ABU2RDL0_9ACTN|nr:MULTISPECIES: CbiX/SirB N-terminal domain-containing protein [unclassified Streptomyces]MBK3595737.1 hypothetical protein [Streptomyces sp. MBT51]MDT0426555.1 CbiX/SirB N-terminal domain-containing protein [Streptomyces sp. DSM 41770]
MPETAPDHPAGSASPYPDATAHLLTRVTDQLVAQLGLVSPNGTRRPVHRTRRTARQAPTLVAVAHGSRDPRAARTVLELLDRVREPRPGLDVRLGHIELNAPLLPATLDGLGGVPVVPAYASALAPDVPTALRALAARGRHRVAVASYFTAPGRFAAAAVSAAPWIAAAPLGAHPATARLLLHRYDQALTEGASARPRAHPPAPAPERPGRPGGLRLPSAPGQGR